MQLNRALAEKYGTDKGGHIYMPLYDRYLSRLRDKKFNLLEIGIATGGSIRMWAAYFTKAVVYGVDIKSNCSIFHNGRIKVFVGDIKEKTVHDAIVSDAKSFDVIIDDGSHHWMEQKIAIDFLYPYLNDGGFYVIEDLPSDTSYLNCLLYNFGYDTVHIHRRPCHDILFLEKGPLAEHLNEAWPV